MRRERFTIQQQPQEEMLDETNHLEGDQTKDFKHNKKNEKLPHFDDQTMMLQQEDMVENEQEFPENPLGNVSEQDIENVFVDLFEAEESQEKPQQESQKPEEEIQHSLDVPHFKTEVTPIAETKDTPPIAKKRLFVDWDELKNPQKQESQIEDTQNIESIEQTKTPPVKEEYIDPNSPEYFQMINPDKFTADGVPLFERTALGNIKTPQHGTFDESTFRFLGQGGMGEVGLIDGIQTINGRSLPITGVLKRPAITNEKIIASLQEEARILKRLKEQEVPNIIEIYGMNNGYDESGNVESVEMIMENGGNSIENEFKKTRTEHSLTFFFDNFDSLSPEQKETLFTEWSSPNFDFEDLYNQIMQQPRERRSKHFFDLFTSRKRDVQTGRTTRAPIIDRMEQFIKYFSVEEQENFLQQQLEIITQNSQRYISAYESVDAMEQLDAQIVHRDFKPANIVFNEQTNETKVIDPGVALEYPPEYSRKNFNSRKEQLQAIQQAIREGHPILSKLASNLIIGTPTYMYPIMSDNRSALHKLDCQIVGAEVDKWALQKAQFNDIFKPYTGYSFPMMSNFAMGGGIEPHDPKRREIVSQILWDIKILNNEGQEERLIPDAVRRSWFVGDRNKPGFFSEQRELIHTSGKKLGEAMAEIPKRLQEYTTHAQENQRRVTDALRKANNFQYVDSLMGKNQDFDVFDFEEFKIEIEEIT